MNIPIIQRDGCEINTQTSIEVRPVIVERAIWKVKKLPQPDGRTGIKFAPIKGTWFAYVLKDGATSHVVPMISCPACAMILFLSTEKSAPGLMAMLGHAVPISHQISSEGKVSPDLRCDPSRSRRCGFHRQVYLDKWHSWRPLYVTAYVEGANPEIKFAYSHAASRQEARMHLGVGDFMVIDVGRAVGYLYDEKKKTATADVASKLETSVK